MLPKQLRNADPETTQQTPQQGEGGGHTALRGPPHGHPLPTAGPRGPKPTLVREASCLWTQVEMLRQTAGHAQPHLAPTHLSQWSLYSPQSSPGSPSLGCLPALSLTLGINISRFTPEEFAAHRPPWQQPPPDDSGGPYNTAGVRLSQEPHPHRPPHLLSREL